MKFSKTSFETSSEPRAANGAALVDVLLATYNGSKYLVEQLDSILAQTHQNIRILVSDDGSTDETLAILTQYRARVGEKMVILSNASHGKGVVRNFETLMKASLDDGLAQWSVFADQDDVWLPEKVAVCLKEMIRIEDIDGAAVPCLVHSDLRVVNDHLEVLAPSFAQYQRMSPGDCTPLSLLSVNQITGCTMMVNRALLRMALPFPCEVIMHDWWCGLICGSGRRSFVETALILYRQHSSNQVGARDRSLKARLVRMATDGVSVGRRVRSLGRSTYAQAEALRQRLCSLGLDDGYVSKYLSWRRSSLMARMTSYRNYYVGPELDRLSRCLLWFG